MAAPRILVPPLTPAMRVLDVPRAEAHHLIHVLRLAVGDEVRVFDGVGREWVGRIAAIGPKTASIEIAHETTPAAEPHVRLTLAIGLLKGDQMDAVVRDANGNPAVVDGDVTWASSDEALCSVAVDAADSTKCLIGAPSITGDAQVTATADADLGDGMRELVLLLDVHVVAGEAVAGTIEPIGEQSPIEAPATP